MKTCINPNCETRGPQPLSAFNRRRGGYAARCRRCTRLGEQQRRAARRDLPAIDREPGGRLPIGPWRSWLERQEKRLSYTEPAPRPALAILLDADPRDVARWLDESKTVLLDSVDLAVCAWGDPGLLRELYPHLYAFGPQAIAS